MQWIHLDEWYCWCYNMGGDEPANATTYPSHYARVPNKLAKRFDRVVAEFQAIQSEIEQYAGKDKE